MECFSTLKIECQNPKEQIIFYDLAVNLISYF